MPQYTELFTMFQKASKSLKYPRITFTGIAGEKVQLYLATKGYIAIKVNNEYVGKIADPTVFKMYQGSNELQQEIIDFCAHPLKSAIFKGQAYNQCCFCGLELTNKASVQVGYGPICADKYGLPWNYTEPDIAEIDLGIQGAPGIAIKPVIVELVLLVNGVAYTIQGKTAISNESDMQSFTVGCLKKFKLGVTLP